LRRLRARHGLLGCLFGKNQKKLRADDLEVLEQCGLSRDP